MRRRIVLVACVAVPRRPVGGPAPRVDRGDPVPSARRAQRQDRPHARTRSAARRAPSRTCRARSRLHAPDRPPPGEDHDARTAARRALQRDLDAKRAELESIQGELRSERARLVRLRARLREARATLATRLVELYKADKPDLVTVVLGSTGFADLLERGEFIRRISDQDRQIVTLVRRRARTPRDRGAPREARDPPAEGHGAVLAPRRDRRGQGRAGRHARRVREDARRTRPRR